MRLRARIQRNLLFFTQAVEKIGKSCYIKFAPEYVAFGAIHGVTDNNHTTGGSIQCWSRIPMENLFHEYRIESNSNNEINLEMKVEDLLVAMRSCTNASAVLMRMTGQRAEPYLTFTITTEDHLGGMRPITQNVPIIKIMTIDGANNVSVFEEPMIPDPEVHIMLPQLERLKHITTSYKSIAEFVVISANLAGEMILTTSDGTQQLNHDDMGEGSLSARYRMADKAHVETRFTNLHNPVVQDDEGDHAHLVRLRTRPKEFASVLVRVVDLQKVLQSQYVKPLNVICSIVPNHSVLFYVYLKDQKDDNPNAALSYFIPEIN
ncbi:hypothetical protein BGX34_000190 [Mortierella sp. NVP85]|nr:hypothetical protein BGX34_000190 [Mortierella sp. NVP85]